MTCKSKTPKLCTIEVLTSYAVVPLKVCDVTASMVCSIFSMLIKPSFKQYDSLYSKASNFSLVIASAMTLIPSFPPFMILVSVVPFWKAADL